MPAKTPSISPDEMPGLPPLDYPSSTCPSGGGATAGATAGAGEPADIQEAGSETGRAGSNSGPGQDQRQRQAGSDSADGPEGAGPDFTEALHDGAALGRKLLAAFETNMTAGFGFASAMAEAGSLPDMIALSSRFAARQFETALTQGKDLWTAGEKLMGDAARGFAPADGNDPDDAGPGSGRR